MTERTLNQEVAELLDNGAGNDGHVWANERTYLLAGLEPSDASDEGLVAGIANDLADKAAYVEEGLDESKFDRAQLRAAVKAWIESRP